MRIVRSIALHLLFLPAALPSQSPPASGKKVLGIEDYTRWRSIAGSELSADGKWVVYGLRQVNTLPTDAKPVLRLRNVATGTETEIVDASQPSFSPDGKWLTYLVETQPKKPATPAKDSAVAPPAVTPTPATPPAAGGRGAGGNQVTRRWELRELATGKVQVWQDIASATFSPTARHLVLRRRPATPATGGAPAQHRG